MIIQFRYFDYMFSLFDLRFALCSRNLDVLRAQRIMGFFIFITHKSKRSENPITLWKHNKCIKVPIFSEGIAQTHTQTTANTSDNARDVSTESKINLCQRFKPAEPVKLESAIKENREIQGESLGLFQS